MLRLTGLFVGTAARPPQKGLSHTVHDTAHEHGRLFFEVYGVDVFLTVVELGSQDVNGSLREHCPEGVHYIGLDVMPAKGVDLVVDPGCSLPLATGTADAIVTSSAFEHDICFWDTFLELTRILRPGGLLYVNVPSNGDFHRYPLDCWRFYPDAGVALVQWAGRRGIEIELIESFIGLPHAERWADFVAVFRKAGGTPLASKGRISDRVPGINIHRLELPAGESLGAETESMPDTTIAANLSTELTAAHQENAMLSAELVAAGESNATLSANLATASADLDGSRRHNDALSAELETTSAKLETTLAGLETTSAELVTTQAAAAGLRRDLSGAELRIEDLEIALASVRRDIAAMQNSTSWRMTGGLRRLMIGLRGH
jgi:SAM-dependent methyltransferase